MVDPIYHPAHLMHYEYDLYSDLTNLIDLRVVLLDLRITVYPDGGNRPVGVSRSTTSCNTITDLDHRSKRIYNGQPITSALPHLHITYGDDPNL